MRGDETGETVVESLLALTPDLIMTGGCLFMFVVVSCTAWTAWPKAESFALVPLTLVAARVTFAFGSSTVLSFRARRRDRYGAR